MINFLSINNLTVVVLIEIFGFLLGALVYLNNPKRKDNQFFSLMTFSVLLLLIFCYLVLPMRKEIMTIM